MKVKNSESISYVRVKSINIYVIHTDSGPILFDTGYKESGNQVLKHLNKHGYEPSDVNLIIVSHGHDDHFGSASYLREVTGAPVAAHSLDRIYIEAGRNPEVEITDKVSSDVVRFIKEQAKRKSPPCKVDLLLDKNFNPEDFSLGGKIIETPGHTEGSVSYIYRSKALIADILSGRLTSPSTPRLPLFAYDTGLVRQSLEKVLSHNVKTLYPAHGGSFSSESVRFLLDRDRDNT